MSFVLSWQMVALLGGIAFAFASREVVFRLTRNHLREMLALIAAYLAWVVIFAVGLATLPWLNGLIFPDPTDTLQSNGVLLLTHLPWALPLLVGAPVVMLFDLGFWLARRTGIVKQTSRSSAEARSTFRD